MARVDCKPKSEEPKDWFTSMKSLAEVLSDDNRALLRVITETRPESICALAEATGRKHTLNKGFYALKETKQDLLISYIYIK